MNLVCIMSLSNIILLFIYSELFLEEKKYKTSRVTNPDTQTRLHQTTGVLNSGKVFTESLVCKKNLKIWSRSRQVLEDLFLVLVLTPNLGLLLAVFISILITKPNNTFFNWLLSSSKYYFFFLSFYLHSSPTKALVLN